MVRNAILFLAGVVSMYLLILQWSTVLAIVHILLGR